MVIALINLGLLLIYYLSGMRVYIILSIAFAFLSQP